MAYFQKRSGSWRAIVKRKGFERSTRTFDTKAEAEVWAATLESEIGRGVYRPQKEAETTTLAEALDRYEREISSEKKGATKEASRIKFWKAHPLAGRSLASIQGKDLATFRDERLKAGYAASSILNEIAVISHLFTIAAQDWGMTGLVNPVLQIRKPKRAHGRERRLKPDELERIQDASESPCLASVVRFAVETAMRQSEIAGMTWEMVDLKKRTVALPDTKNGEKRVVPLTAEAGRILSDLPRRLDGQVWGVQSHSISVAFRRAVTRARNAYLKECEGEGTKPGTKPDPGFLVDLTFHDLRHEATSRLFERRPRLNVLEVARITGHKTLEMLKRYTHLQAEDIVKALDESDL